MGLFGKKVDYDELYRKLSTEKMTGRELKKAEKLLDKLEYSGDRRGILWRPLISVQWKCADNASYYFSKAESKLGLCEEYIHIRSLPIVVNLLIEEYEYTPKPGDVIFSDVYRPHLRVVVFVARAYEHGWGVEKNHEKAVEIIRETESYPKDGTFSVNSDLIKNAYKEITGKEFPDSESSEQKEKQAISDAAKSQNEQPQSDINFKRVEYDGGDVYEGEILNGKRHGHGTYTWADGDTYEGDWRDGKRCGRGKLIQYGKSPSGETYMKYSYDGEWLDSKEHGHGICVEGDFSWFKNDKVLEGEWVKGKRQGRFVWYLTNSKGGRYMDFYEDGDLIETCIPYDERIKTVDDAKKFREAEKRARISAVKTDFRLAKQLDMNIAASVGYYDGDYMNGERNGYGECAYDNGDKYIGTWKDGAANGVGRYDFARGGFYFGQFLNGRVDGYGVYFDGNDYHIGMFENGECVTERDLVFEIGSKGKWLPLGFESDESIQIYGDLKNPSGAIMKNSEGVEYSSSARMWVARFNGNLMVMGKVLQKGGPINDQNGVFIYTDHADGLVATGEIRNSMLNGRVTIRYITGETVEADCVDNKPIETYHSWDKFGREVW